MVRSDDPYELLKIQIGGSLEQHLSFILDQILADARRSTRAEAGTLYLREGERLRFAMVQNDRWAQRLGEPEMRELLHAELLPISGASLAGYVALTGEVLNIPDVYAIPPERPYTFDRRLDDRTGYRTRSVLIVPLQDPSGTVRGVLQLINALNERNEVIPFHPDHEPLLRALASRAAVAVSNADFEALSFMDDLTGVFDRRYLMLRLKEEAHRHARFGQPVSLVLIALNPFQEITDRVGQSAGNETLRELSRLLREHSRGFTVITRYGADEFAVLLVNTPKAGGVAYTQRIRGIVERHAFRHGPLTVSFGVASLPDDVSSGDDLTEAAHRALSEAKRLGRNPGGVL